MDSTEITMGFTKLIVVFATLAGLQGCTLARAIVHNFADRDDHRIFANRVVPSSARTSPLGELRHAPVPLLRALTDAVMAPSHLAEIDRLDVQRLAAR